MFFARLNSTQSQLLAANVCKYSLFVYLSHPANNSHQKWENSLISRFFRQLSRLWWHNYLLWSLRFKPLKNLTISFTVITQNLAFNQIEENYFFLVRMKITECLSANWTQTAESKWKAQSVKFKNKKTVRKSKIQIWHELIRACVLSSLIDYQIRILESKLVDTSYQQRAPILSYNVAVNFLIGNIVGY